MNSLRSLMFAGGIALAGMPVACGDDAPRMRVVTQHVRAGDVVVVHFDRPPVAQFGRGDVWLTLVPAGSTDESLGQRRVIEEGAAEAAIPAGSEGTYELRLVDRSPRRFSSVVTRLSLEVDRAAVARSEAPPWFW